MFKISKLDIKKISLRKFLKNIKHKAGRNNKGHITVRSKSSNNIKRLYLNTKLHKTIIRLLSFNITTYIRFRKNLILMQYLSNGSYSLAPTTKINIPGTLLFPNNTIISITNNYYTYINTIRIGSTFIYLQFNNLIIATAIGSKCIMLFKKQLNNFILTPSGSIIIISKNIICLETNIFLENKVRFLTKPVKLMRINFKRPIVRGTVKNACDHPNGGRTRTLKKSKTPWGKIVKKKKYAKN